MNRSLSLLSLCAVLLVSACATGGTWTPMSDGRTAGGSTVAAASVAAPQPEPVAEAAPAVPAAPVAPVVEEKKVESPAPKVPSKADKTISEALRK